MTCGVYMAPYISENGGYLTNSTVGSTLECEFCVIADTNAFLARFGIFYEDRWRNFGIMWGYVAFNVVMAVLLYWAVRVPKKGKGKHL